MFTRSLVALAGLAIGSCAFAQTATTFTYQGELRQDGTLQTGSFDLSFRLFDSAAGTTQLGPTLCVDDIAIVDGKFIVALDFGSQFSQPGRHLEIAVRSDTGHTCSSPAGFSTLAPRQPITGAPAASFASAASSAVTATTALTATNAAQLNGQPSSFYTSATNLAAGTLPDARLSTNVPRSNTANVFTAANTFASDVQLNARIGSATAGVTVMSQNQNVFRITPAGVIGSTFSPNIAAGSPTNTIDPASIGAAILSGGNATNSNLITGLSNHAVIAGGINNAVNAGVAGSIAGGSSNTVSGAHSAIGGGQSNIVGSQHNTIAGGNNNATSNPFSTVGGGSNNQARGTASVVSGGQNNESLASFAAVPGGQLNVAGGEFSLAAGRRAKIRTPAQVGAGDLNGDEGTFVFADSTDADFISTGPNQFLVRATGGVGINNATPLAPLHVSAPAGATLGRLIIAPGIANSNSELFLSENTSTSIGATLRYEGTVNQIQFLGRTSSIDSAPHMTIGRDSGNVGIGTTTPAAKLDVNGSAIFSDVKSRGDLVTGGELRFADGTIQRSAGTVTQPPVFANGSLGGHRASFDGVTDNLAQMLGGFSFTRSASGVVSWTQYPTFQRRRTGSTSTWQSWAAGTAVPATLEIESLNATFVTVVQRWTMSIVSVREYQLIIGDDGGPLERITFEVTAFNPPAPLVVNPTAPPSTEDLFGANNITLDATFPNIAGTDLDLSRIPRTINFTRSGAQLLTRFTSRQNAGQGGFMANWWAANDIRAGQIRGRNASSGALVTITSISQARLAAYSVRVDDSTRLTLYEEFTIEAVTP
ncbi:MAG: hypothetical protein ACK5Q4_12135 [Phycisphaerae bacterium]|jgi:hypothetical protein